MLEIATKNRERPHQEMKRLMRVIAGKVDPGEKDIVLIERAVRRMNSGLQGDDLIGPRRARTYWYGESRSVDSIHMDRARDLAFVQPIEEAFNALSAAEQYLDDLRARLLDRTIGSSRHRGDQRSHGAPGPRAAVPAGGDQIRNSRSTVRGLLTSSQGATP